MSRLGGPGPGRARRHGDIQRASVHQWRLLVTDQSEFSGLRHTCTVCCAPIQPARLMIPSAVRFPTCLNSHTAGRPHNWAAHLRCRYTVAPLHSADCGGEILFIRSTGRPFVRRVLSGPSAAVSRETAGNVPFLSRKCGVRKTGRDLFDPHSAFHVKHVCGM